MNHVPWEGLEVRGHLVSDLRMKGQHALSSPDPNPPGNRGAMSHAADPGVLSLLHMDTGLIKTTQRARQGIASVLPHERRHHSGSSLAFCSFPLIPRDVASY